MYFFTSCQSVNKDKVKETVETFFSAYRGEDVATAVSIYPKLTSLRGNFRKSSSIDLNTTDIWVLNDSNIIVNLTHHWINPFGADNTAKKRLYMAKKDDKYEIVDSKNFCMYDEVILYNFACKTGAVMLFSDTTDITISEIFDTWRRRLSGIATNHARQLLRVFLRSLLVYHQLPHSTP